MLPTRTQWHTKTVFINLLGRLCLSGSGFDLRYKWEIAYSFLLEYVNLLVLDSVLQLLVLNSVSGRLLHIIDEQSLTRFLYQLFSAYNLSLRAPIVSHYSNRMRTKTTFFLNIRIYVTRVFCGRAMIALFTPERIVSIEV